MKKKILRNEPLLAWILITILSVIWGSSFVLIKKGLDVFSPAQVGAARMAFAFLIMLPFAITNLKKLPARKWLIIILVGLIGNLIPAYLFALAETELKSSLTGILNALTPIFTLIISVSFFRHKASGLQIFGLLLAFSGSLGLSFINDNGNLGNMNYYVWLVVIATLLYAVSVNLIKSFFSGTGSVILTSFAMFSIGPISIAYLFSTDFFHRISYSTGAFQSLLYIMILGVIGTAFALILYNKLIKISTTVFASSVTYLIPFVAVIWGLIDGENLFFLHYVGMIIVIAGIYIISKEER